MTDRTELLVWHPVTTKPTTPDWYLIVYDDPTIARASVAEWAGEWKTRFLLGPISIGPACPTDHRRRRKMNADRKRRTKAALEFCHVMARDKNGRAIKSGIPATWARCTRSFYAGMSTRSR